MERQKLNPPFRRVSYRRMTDADYQGWTCWKAANLSVAKIEGN